MVAAAVAFALVPAAAMATKPNWPTYTLFGDGELVHPGYESETAAQASYDGCTSSCEADSKAYGGINFAVPSGLVLKQLE